MRRIKKEQEEMERRRPKISLRLFAVCRTCLAVLEGLEGHLSADQAGRQTKPV